jgi:hypothetical protein
MQALSEHGCDGLIEDTYQKSIPRHDDDREVCRRDYDWKASGNNCDAEESPEPSGGVSVPAIVVNGEPV